MIKYKSNRESGESPKHVTLIDVSCVLKSSNFKVGVSTKLTCFLQSSKKFISTATNSCSSVGNSFNLILVPC